MDYFTILSLGHWDATNVSLFVATCEFPYFPLVVAFFKSEINSQKKVGDMSEGGGKRTTFLLVFF